MSRSDYVLGLIAGEGSFSIGIEYTNSYKYNVATRWLFHLSMADRNAVETVADEIGLDTNIKTRERGGDRSTMYEILIRNKEQIENVIEWVNNNRTVPFDRSVKANVFDKWAQLWAERNDLMSSKDGTKELARRAYHLNSRKDVGKDIDEILARIDAAE